MTPQTALARWLRCPSCHRALTERGRLVLGCDNGHRLDVNKRGYATVLPPRQRPHIGDDEAMLLARERVLGDGLYSPIKDAVVALAATTATTPPAIADMGCGTGYYLEAVAAAQQAPTHTDGIHPRGNEAHPQPRVRTLACDLSPAAVTHTLRRLRAAPEADDGSREDAGLVADIWHPLPLRDGAATVVLDVFAPRRLEEFARILTPAGVLVVVVPTERHFAELTAAGLALRVPAGKADRLRHAAGQLQTLTETDHTRLQYTVRPSPAQKAALSAMGPAAHHTDALASAPAAEKGTSTDTITVSVDVLRFERTDVSAQRAK